MLTTLALVASLLAAPLDSKSVAPTPPPRAADTNAVSNLGYYRMPAVHGDTVVFAAEGDLWMVPIAGGRAARLTTHASEERLPAISPDGTTLAFLAGYEGTRDLYTMPLAGGLPTRRTFDNLNISFVGWTPDGALLYGSDAGASRGSARLYRQDLASGTRTVIPLDQAAEGAILPDGKTLVFTRLEFQGSHTDRYQGGTAQQLWRFVVPAAGQRGDEAVLLTGDYPGTSRRPMVGPDGRVYFTTDRDGRMNLWSMTPEGKDLKQHTKHADYDIGSSSLDGNRIVYQLGPDLWVYDLKAGTDSKLAITLDSDFDQTRERWVTDGAKGASSVAVSPNGERIVLTSRGRVFVVPVKQGRTIDVDPRSGIRYREACFLDDETVLAISDESGELELVTMPADGLGTPTKLTSDGETVRWRALPSPDGKRIAHSDKRLRLWVYDLEKHTNTLVEENKVDAIGDFAWSADSRWLAYTSPAANNYRQIKLWPAEGGTTLVATTDRYDSYAPEFSPDGKWLWFLSDRTFRSVVGSPWGPRQPEPFFDKSTRMYGLALKAGTRSPFQPDDEVEAARKKKEAEDKEKEKPKEPEPATPSPETKDPAAAAAPKQDKPDKPEAPAKDDAAKGKGKKDAKPPAKVEIDADGLVARLIEVPVGAANMSQLFATDTHLFWVSTERAVERGERGDGVTLHALAISNEKAEPKAVASGVRGVERTADRKKILLRKGESYFVVDANGAPASLEKGGVDVGAVVVRIVPREEWREIAIDSWRLLRDYFYDRNMHGVDWRAVLDKYLPWVDRVRSRDELNDILQEMTGELSALHHFVRGGDIRTGDTRIEPASLGAELVRDEAAGGWRIVSIPTFDPDEPADRPPLASPIVAAKVGEVVRAIDGAPTLGAPDPSMLLRAKAGRQVRLTIASQDGTATRDAIVIPISQAEAAEQRYRGWELERRAIVEDASKGDFAYLHLRAMGGGDMADFARDYYPAFNRKGLIIDVRGNRGGNIDSWILSRLMRKPWMYWSQAAGRSPDWNMQFAFHGPMVVLCDGDTASDGEAFTEGFKRLGLGKVIGMRTWGGEIWLSSSNRSVDGGLASAGESGVFDAKGVWLIEGWGAEPDIVVDNLPHATFLGEDAQLKAAIELLKKELAEHPVKIPEVPTTPVKVKK